MPLNIGYMQVGNGSTYVRVYYSTSGTVGPSQALVNGPNGFCLEYVGAPKVKAGASAVTKSLTLAQVKALGMSTRGQVSLTTTG